MMHSHRCSSSQVGPCSCDHYHYYPHQQYHPSSQSYSSSSSSPPTSFSVLFSQPYENGDEMYSFGSGVDCTLSLGTPSTRSTDDATRQRRSDSSRVSNFCWDLLQPKAASSQHKSGARGGHNGNTGSSNNSDPLVARRCANCDTTSTPLWRNGPRGPKSLCNACGIRFKKEERRATAAAAAPAMESPACHYSQPYGHVGQWNGLSQYSQPQKLFSSANDFRYGDDTSHADSDAAGISFLSWRLNVTDRPSLVHDFTR